MANQGILQAQLKVKNSINLENGFIDNPLLKSVEGDGQINLTDENSFKGFASNTAIEHLDIVKNSSQNAIDLTNSLNNLSNIKYVRLEGSYESKGNSFDNNTNLQKVDLSESLVVKPEDFKGNNSLKELPKLDFSNPDLTDIITNATSLKPTTIDISNQNNTTCLGVHGDSTHQLGTLQFVKVSPEATFDNQITPQIDVSYTSLDRNGLVNLFNTMPYNVGYTVVGNPTIVDGIVSGFSYSDRLNITANVANSDIAEMVWKFKLDSSGLKNNYNFIFYKTSGNLQISIYGNSTSQTFNAPSIYLPGPNQSHLFTNFIPSYDVWYWVKYTYDGTTVRLYSSTDGTNYTLRNTIENVTITGTGGVYQIGWGSSQDPTSIQYFSGSIDLNETYIKVNGKLWFGHESALVPWFNGQPSMTKTIKITGTAGTSSLTSDEKAIVTNKGWTLQEN